MTDALTEGPAPASKPRPPFVIEPRSGLFEWRELWRFRDLLLRLIERDVRLRYRQTALGIVWVILQPLVTSLIFAAVFGLFAKLPSDGSPYLLFVFAGMLPWNLFAGGVQRASNSLIANAGLVTKIYLPREIIPLASVLATCLDFLVAAGVMFAMLLLYGIPMSPTLLVVPVLVVVTLEVAIGVSLIFSALSVYYRDFTYALPFIVQAWMYGSPVVYASSLVPERWHLLYGLNPLVGVIDGFRWAVLGGAPPTMTLAESVIGATLILVAGAVVFRRVERNFADVI